MSVLYRGSAVPKIVKCTLQIQTTVTFRAQVCSGLIAETAGSNSAEGTDVPILLGSLTELRKPTIGFVMSVRLAVRTSIFMEQLCSH